MVQGPDKDDGAPDSTQNEEMLETDSGDAALPDAGKRKMTGEQQGNAVPSGKTAPRIAASDDEVGRLLRGAYRDVVEEPVPDDLMDLLKRLE